MFGDGLANAADAPFHAHRIYALARLIESGDLYPRWAPYFHLGYGYPIFTYYAPGATHIGAWLHLLGFDVISAYTLTTVLAWCIGSVGMWLLARRFLPTAAALLACILWVYAPSRFFEFWWQGSLAQIVSTSFIPFLFFGILLTRRAPKLRNCLWIALPLAAIILTHTPTTYIVCQFAMPCILLAALCGRSWRAAASRLRYMLVGLALGAGLSAIFWLPVAAELSYVKIAGELRDTVDFLRHGFLSLPEIASLPQKVDSNDATLLMSRTLGLVGIVLSALGVLALVLRRRVALALLLLAGMIAAILMTMELSLDVWLTMPGFRNLRFPSRIIRLGALFVALLGASSALLLPARWRTAGALALSAAVIWQALPIMHPRDDDRAWRELSAKDEIAMEHAERNWGTTAYNEYLPVWGSAIPFDLPLDLDSYAADPLRIRVYRSDIERRQDAVSYQYLADNQILITVAGKAVTLRLRQFYMPGWRLTVDGLPYPFQADDHFGLIEFRLPEGIHLLRLDYAGTPVQHLAAVISVASFAGWLLILRLGTATQGPPAPGPNISRRAVLLTSGALIVFAVVNAAWLQDNVFRIGLEDGKPAYMRQALRAVFDGAITLEGYTLKADAISDNEPLAIRLYWRLASKPQIEYRPLVQLVDFTVAGAWAVSQPHNFEGGSIANLAPDQFMSDGHKLKLLDYAPPYVGRISIQLMRNDGSGSLAQLPDGSTRLLLPEVIKIIGPDEASRGRSRGINFGAELTLHCLETARHADEFTGTLHWQVVEQPARDLLQFVHGLDEGQAIVAQNDSEPLEGLYPTSHWRKGQRIKSGFALELVEGVKQVAIGLYNPEDGKRVPITVDGTSADQILLKPDDSAC